MLFFIVGKIKRTILLSLLAFSVGSTQGCMVAMVGAGVGAWKWGSSKQTEANVDDKKAYNGYVVEMEKINIQREGRGLEDRPILTYDQYLKIKK